MGWTSYSEENRAKRAASLRYSLVTHDETVYRNTFTQVDKKEIHPLMKPYRVIVEARDSENHPESIPVILALDVTGSMGSIPRHFLAEGLPKLFSKLIQADFKDIALCFVAVGDHVTDIAPLQVGQFESGDVELDEWLTRIWPEGGGGANYGESYFLPWIFANEMVVTDHWEKRGKKGFIFTIGDEPCLDGISENGARNLLGISKHFTVSELLPSVQEKWNVFHFHLLETHSGSRSSVQDAWLHLLGQNAIMMKDYRDIPDKIQEILVQNLENKTIQTTTEEEKEEFPI